MDFDCTQRPSSGEAAIAAARARMATDRHVRRLEQVLLTAVEERGLGLLIRAGGGPLHPGGLAALHGERRSAAETLILHNRRLVHHVARLYPSHTMDYEDRVSAGTLGLMRAVELFDPEAGCKFSTYATWWIRQTVTRTLAIESRTIRVPVNVYERIVRVARADRQFALLAGELPSAAAVAADCALTEAQVRECRRLARDVCSLDLPSTQIDLALGKSTPDPDEQWWGLDAADVREAVDALPVREREVVRRRFGLDGNGPQTLDQIGKSLGVTRERIRQIEVAALAKLRRAVIDEAAAA